MKTHSMSLGVWGLLYAAPSLAAIFTVSGGQIFTPGLAVVDAPQPGTPLGGGLFLCSHDPESGYRA